MANKDINKVLSKTIPNLPVSKIPLIASVVMLLLEVFSHRSPGFQTLMKFVVCGSSGYLAYLSKGLKNDYWMWGFVLIAILFNPIAPISMDRDLRLVLYLAVVFLFALIYYVRYLSKS